MCSRGLEVVRAGAAGAAATATDVVLLGVLVACGMDPRIASIPALVAGGAVNFLGNRHFAFRASSGSLARQALGYALVEVVALVLNGALYDATLVLFPETRAAFWVVRLVTSHVVFLCWSYPLWRRVFRVPVAVEADAAGSEPVARAVDGRAAPT
jgi:putative flippase GtrA